MGKIGESKIQCSLGFVGVSRAGAIPSATFAGVPAAALAKRTATALQGYYWVASRHLDIGMLVQSGGQFRWDYVGRWWTFIPQSQWPLDDYRRQGVLAKWDDITGDCRQEIVLIGQGIDLDILKQQLDACLLTPQEIMEGPQTWPTLPGATAFDLKALSP